MDVVGYSKLLINDQSETLEELSGIVRNTSQFREADAAGKLIRLATGDGMALVFFNNAEEPVKCALEIAEALQNYPKIPLRMGVHSGPINPISDVNNRTNVTGAGINMAQRVMDCGDAGHILLSRRVAEDLELYRQWQPDLHDLGECEVKHGVRVHVFNLYTDKLGNRNIPTKLKLSARQDRQSKRRLIVVITALFLLLGLAAGYWVIGRRLSKPVASSSAPNSNTTAFLPEKSIAVLPLENLSEEKENAFFADGIQDELLSNLAKIKDLKVISRTSVMQYKSGITRNLKEIAQQLGVSSVVEGSVRRSGNHIRVSVQLIDALMDRHIWSQNYDRTMADSLALQGELAIEIANAIGATLSPQEKARVEATPTTNTAAYQAYLRGRALLTAITVDDSNVQEAPRSFEQAVTLDPTFALAWVYLSCADSNVYWRGVDPTAARLAAAKNAMDHAVALDPNLPETHLAVGYYRFYGLRDFTGALAEFQLAEKNLPNNVDVLRAIGLIQRRFARWDEAIAVLRRVVELDPRNIESASILATTYMATRRFADAIAVADHMFAVEPSNTAAIWIKTTGLWALAKPEAADAVLANPGTDVHLRAHAALNKRHYNEAVELFMQALNSNRLGDEKNALLLDIGLTQQRTGNVAASRAAYEQAVQQLTQELSAVSKDSGPEATLHSLLGVAYAGLGNAPAAVSEGRKGIALQPTSDDPFEGPEREEDMAKIYALLDDADHAIPILKRLTQVSAPTEIVPALLRLNPIWDSIRDDPRFQELVAEKKP